MIYSSFIFVYFVPTNSLSVSSLFLDCDCLDLDLRVDYHMYISCFISIYYRKSWCTMISIVLDSLSLVKKNNYIPPCNMRRGHNILFIVSL